MKVFFLILVAVFSFSGMAKTESDNIAKLKVGELVFDRMSSSYRIQNPGVIIGGKRASLQDNGYVAMAFCRLLGFKEGVTTVSVSPTPGVSLQVAFNTAGFVYSFTDNNTNFAQEIQCN